MNESLVARLIETTGALLAAFGGDIPDWIRGEVEAVATALVDLDADQDHEPTSI